MKRNVRRVLLIVTSLCFAVCGAGLISACGKGEHVHDYVWVTTKEATCTEAGSRTGTCRNKGCPGEEKVVTEDIPALGHLWGSWREIEPYATCTEGGKETRTCTRKGCDADKEKEGAQPATEERDTLPLGHAWDEGVPVKGHERSCTNDGLLLYTCDECGTTKTEKVEAFGHTWQLLERTKEPTCTAAGEESHRCTVCGTVEDGAVVAPLGHDWETAKRVAATCTEAGSRTLSCSRCDETKKIEIAPLGHNWEGFYTVDTPATFEHAGERSYHCARCGERDETRVDAIPQLNENTPIEYEFRLLRNNGAAVSDSSVVIHVYDEEGKEVARSRTSTLKNGVFKVDLLPKTYTAKIEASTLPAGYSAEEEYEVDYGDPVCKIRLTASPIGTAASGSVQYGVGSVLHDFTYDTLNGETITFSALLKKYKLVVLNFFYVNCTWCNREFPGLVSAYNEYKDDVCVIAIDPDPYKSDTESVIRTYAASYGMTFYVVRDTTLRLHARFGVSRYPQTAFIDREGVVAEYHDQAIVESTSSGGYDSARLFEELFAKYTADGYWQHGEGASSAPAALLDFKAALPARRERY